MIASTATRTGSRVRRCSSPRLEPEQVERKDQQGRQEVGQDLGRYQGRRCRSVTTATMARNKRPGAGATARAKIHSVQAGSASLDDDRRPQAPLGPERPQEPGIEDATLGHELAGQRLVDEGTGVVEEQRETRSSNAGASRIRVAAAMAAMVAARCLSRRAPAAR